MSTTAERTVRHGQGINTLPTCYNAAAIGHAQRHGKARLSADVMEGLTQRVFDGPTPQVRLAAKRGRVAIVQSAGTRCANELGSPAMGYPCGRSKVLLRQTEAPFPLLSLAKQEQPSPRYRRARVRWWRLGKAVLLLQADNLRLRDGLQSINAELDAPA